MARSAGGRGGGGRIRPGDRATDNEAPLIGGDVDLSEEHQANIASTESKEMKDSCRIDYRNREKRIIEWWRNSTYSAVAQQGVRPFTEAEKSNPAMYTFNKKETLVCRGFNVKFFKAFLADCKVKKIVDGKTYLKSFDDLRKYYDAVVWVSKTSKEKLPENFFVEMDKWKASYKKECADAKADGRVEENDAEPIGAALFEMILGWAIAENNIFVWVFSLFQWNLMARSINVDPLSFHNIKRGPSDSLEVLPDKTKSDQAGEFVTMKNIYGNPLKPLVNIMLALAVYISLNATRLRSTEKLFQEEGNKPGSASKKY